MSAGFTFLLKRGDGATPTEVFTTVGALRGKTLTMNGNPIDVTTDDDVDGNNILWTVSEVGVHSFEISASGISKTSNKASVQAVMDDFLTGVATNYQTVIPIFGTFQGALVVTAFNITAQHDGAIEFDLTIQSNGAPAFTPEP